MAHNLFRNNMAFVGSLPWHSLGKRVPADVDNATMLHAAGLDWKVSK
jgi:hypothetical protein